MYRLSRLHGRLGLPEVQELELRRTLIRAGLEAISAAKAKLDPLRPLLEHDLPTQELLEKRVDDRIAELSPLLERQKFTFQHAKAALQMVVDELPPNATKNQQFKDSAIWQATLSLARRFEVHVVTDDRAFFLDKDTAKGLTRNLLADCKAAGVTIVFHPDLQTCLKAITPERPSFDVEFVESIIRDVTRAAVATQARGIGFFLADDGAVNVDAFPSAKAGRVTIDYTIRFALDGTGPMPSEPAALGTAIGTAYGSANFDPRRKVLEEHFLQEVRVESRTTTVVRSYSDYDAWAPIPRPIDRRWGREIAEETAPLRRD